MSDVFWTSIRNSSGWAWALGEMRRNPGILESRGPNWRETPLHWAIMGNLDATTEICQRQPTMIFSQDEQRRTALDWAVEKIYFLRQQEMGETEEQAARTRALADPARTCALFVFGWLESQSLLGEWSSDAERFARVALTAGELELAEWAESRTAAPFRPEAWLAGLAGMWRSRAEVSAYLDSVERKHGYAPGDVAMGRPLGLHVAKLWADGQVDAQRAVWFHECGARLDQETRDESIEIFCAQQGSAGAARLEALGRALGW